MIAKSQMVETKRIKNIKLTTRHFFFLFLQFYTYVIQAHQSVWLSTDACISAVVTMRIERADLSARHTLSLVVPSKAVSWKYG